MLCDLKNIIYMFKNQDKNTIFKLSNLRIEKTAHSLILGPSGCGKSTLLNLLAASLTPNEGEIHILGQDILQLKGLQKDSFRAENMGIIFQQFNLLPFADIYTNITLSLRFSLARRQKVKNIPQEVKRLLLALNLDADQLLYKKANQLSVGQQQRVAAARALIGNPQIILADEPTSALDDDTTFRFINLIFDVAKQQGSTLIMVSHDTRLKTYFEQVIYLNNIAEIISC